MATPPLVCNTIEFEGLIFQRCNLQSVKGNTVVSEVSFCDTNISLDEFNSFKACVYPGSSMLLTAEGLSDVTFILIKASYPNTLPVASRFINIIYNGNYLPMSNLTILTGNTANPQSEWDLDPNGSDIESPFFSQGGMLLYNPHSVRVNVEIIIGSGISTADTSFIVTETGDLTTDGNGNFITE